MLAAIKKFIRMVVPGAVMSPIDKALYEYRSSKKMAERGKTVAHWEKLGKPVPPPGEVKHNIVDAYQHAHGSKVLVETGTYKGDMIEAQRKNFKQIYTIELSDRMYQYAKDRFRWYDHIHVLHGDSGKLLDTVTKQLNEQAIFWLDGHYSSGITAKAEDTECPIYAEIDAVFRYKNYDHIILVDDARCFTHEGVFIDYPTIDQLTEYIKKKDSRYEVEVKDDVIRYVVKK